MLKHSNRETERGWVGNEKQEVERGKMLLNFVVTLQGLRPMGGILLSFPTYHQEPRAGPSVLSWPLLAERRLFQLGASVFLPWLQLSPGLGQAG